MSKDEKTSCSTQFLVPNFDDTASNFKDSQEKTFYHSFRKLYNKYKSYRKDRIVFLKRGDVAFGKLLYLFN